MTTRSLSVVDADSVSKQKATPRARKVSKKVAKATPAVGFKIKKSTKKETAKKIVITDATAIRTTVGTKKSAARTNKKAPLTRGFLV